MCVRECTTEKRSLLNVSIMSNGSVERLRLVCMYTLVYYTYLNTTLNGGSLGSWVDEERS